MALPLHQLRQRLESLPQELYDNIRAQVFTIALTATVVIDLNFKLPHQLHIDQVSREAFANVYFPQTSFVSTSQTLLVKWMRAVAGQHVDAIGEVALIISTGPAALPGISGWNLLVSVQKREILLAVGASWKEKLRVVSRTEGEKRFGVLF